MAVLASILVCHRKRLERRYLFVAEGWARRFWFRDAELHVKPAASLGVLSRSLLAIISGSALALAFPPFKLSLLGWFAFVPLLYAIEGSGAGEVLLIAWLQGAAFCVTSGAWVFTTLHDYAHLSVTTSIIEFAILDVVLAAFGAVAITIAKFVSVRLSVSSLLTLPIAWAAGEWMRVKLPFSFPWNLLGYAVYRDLHLIQFAEFTGIYGISALIMFVNVSVYEIMFTVPSVAARRRILITSTAILSAALLFGEIRIAKLESAAMAGKLRVALISGGLEPARAQTFRTRIETFNLYLVNTRRTLSLHPDLVIWPESAAMVIFQLDGRYSLPMAEDAAFRRSLVELAYDSDTPILFGALAFRQARGKVTMLNRAYLLSRKGEVAGYYDKIRLVPFGEYLPMKQLLAHRVDTITSVRDLAGGERDFLFNVNGTKIGVRICFESAFPDLTRRAVEAGAHILVNLSNDAWYGKIGAEQALMITAMRAVESKTPVVRVANQGFSAIVSPVGKIQTVSQFSTAAGVVRDVSWIAVRTAYVRFGDLFAESCVLLTAAGFMLSVFVSLNENLPRRTHKDR